MPSSSPTTMSLGMASFQATANLQLGSSFFGKLPLEIREMVYSEFWIVSNPRQHIFSHKGHLAHYPCLLVAGKDDERIEEFNQLWRNRRRLRTGSMVVDEKWASRFSSTWNDHWRCEEEMLFDSSQNRRTLFLSALLTCKRMSVSYICNVLTSLCGWLIFYLRYIEALRGLYASIALVFTDLETAHHFLVASPTSTVPFLRSLHFSFVVPYDTLHQHRYHSSNSPDPGPWAGLCIALSNLVRFDSLRRVTLRLDLADDRYWWQVRERWVLSAIRGMLARCLTVQLPEITVEQDWLKPYQYVKGDKTPFRLERYPRLQWVGTDESYVVSRLEFLRPADRRDIVRETRMRKLMKGLKDLIASFKGV